MAWGVLFEPTFGQFSPEGGFTGWDEARKALFEAGLPEDEMALVDPNNALNSYVANVSGRFTMNRYGPVRNHDWPTHFALARSMKKLGSILRVNELVLLIDETLKRIIEELEPDVHAFRPITMTTKAGTPLNLDYYVFVIGTFLDSFDLSGTDDDMVREVAPGLRLWGSSVFAPRDFESLALSDGKHAGRHIWRETSLSGPDFFISDVLRDRIVQAGLLFPKIGKVRGT